MHAACACANSIFLLDFSCSWFGLVWFETGPSPATVTVSVLLAHVYSCTRIPVRRTRPLGRGRGVGPRRSSRSNFCYCVDYPLVPSLSLPKCAGLLVWPCACSAPQLQCQPKDATSPTQSPIFSLRNISRASLEKARLALEKCHLSWAD